MQMIAVNIKNVLKNIPSETKLVAVSKTKTNAAILEAYNVGQRIFGENKVQELVAKYETLPKDIQWHFIGHLQTNKVKFIAPFVSLIHSVDSFKLLKTINQEGIKNGRVLECLLQFHVASEESKFGLSPDEATLILEHEELNTFKNIRIVGVMGMATYTENSDLIRSEFRNLYSIYLNLKHRYFKNDDHFVEISMGMSSDYEIAIQEGSTMIRVGSTIFGDR